MKFLTRSRAGGVFTAALFLGVQLAFAQETVTMAQALDAAWQRTSYAAVTAGQLRRAQAEQSAASALWAAPPSLELSHRSDRWQSQRGARESEVGVAVPLWLPGQRTAKRVAANTEEMAARQSQLVARLQLAGALRDAAAEVHLMRTETAQAAVEATALESLSKDVERRVAAGDLARADALAAQAEWLAAKSRLDQAQEQQQRAELHWRALTGLVPVPALFSKEALEVVDRSVEDHPALSDAATRVELARRRLDLVQSSKRSPPELITSWRQDSGGGSDPAVNSIGIAIRLPFGTEDRNGPLLAAALADLEVAQAKRRQLREQLAAEAAAQRLAVDSSERRATDEARRAQLLRERASLIETSFKAGETGLPDMLRAIAAASQAEAASLRQQVALRTAIARLQQALGIFP